MMRALFLCGALLSAGPVVAATPAPAQVKAAAVSADPAALAAARELMVSSDFQAQIRGLAPRMADTMAGQIRQRFSDSKLPEGLQVQLTAATRTFIASMEDMYTPEVIDQIAAIYARHLTAAEIKHLTAIMRDPVMVKFRQQTPVIMTEMMPIVLTAMQPRQALFSARIRQIMADWFAAHPEDKAKLRSPLAS